MQKNECAHKINKQTNRKTIMKVAPQDNTISMTKEESMTKLPSKLQRLKAARQALNTFYFEAQRPGYLQRPCTDTLPQKPSMNNPRNRTQFYRNR